MYSHAGAGRQEGPLPEGGSEHKGGMNRRKFLAFTATGFVGAFAAIVGRGGIPLLRRASGKRGRIPADLPGAGSIFQPKNDDRV